MEQDVREELTEHFERTIGRPPPGAGERVVAGFRASADRSPHRRLEWAGSAAAIALAVLVVAALVLSRLGHRTQPAVQQEIPEPRSGAAVAYDASRHLLVLFGGTTDDRRSLADTWTWDGRRWTRLHPPASPPGLTPGALMAYDAATGTLVLHGDPGSTWTWDGTTWTQLHPAAEPDLVTGAMGFDGQQLLLVGSPFGMVQGQFVTETWAWDGSTWSRRSPAIRLPVSATASVAYDEARRRLVAFVEHGGTTAAETWTWDGVTWRKEHPAHLPPPRRGAALVYDLAAGGVLLYGGVDARSVALDDVWTWDGRDWMLRKEATR